MSMKRVGSPLVTLVAAGAAAVLGLAGCAPAGDGTRNTSGPAPSPAGSQAGSEQRTTTSAPRTATESSTTGQAAQGSGTAAPADPTRCRSRDLALALGRGSATAGTYYRPLRFTNEGNAPCVLQGFPGVSYVAGEDGDQVGPAAERQGDKGGPVRLAPGGVAHAVVGFVQVRNYDPAACRPTAVRGLRVYPPGETNAMYVEAPGTGCASDDIPGNQLTVRTVEPGPVGS